MTIELKPDQEQKLQNALRSGRYQTIDDSLDDALAAWKEDSVLSRLSNLLDVAVVPAWWVYEVSNVTSLAVRKGA